MTPADFRDWRERCGYPSWEAVALDLRAASSRRMRHLGKSCDGTKKELAMVRNVHYM